MNLEKLVKEEISGNTAKSYVANVSNFHRIQASTMFHEAAEYVKNELVKLGLKDATIEQFPADGKEKYWTYTSPMGWTVRSAELRLKEPSEELMANYEDEPQCLHTYSRSTPAEGVAGELVDVGTGTKPEDYEGKDVRGKFVLAAGRGRAVHEQAVFKFGASAVITDALSLEIPNARESIDVPDAHAYQSIWPTAEEMEKVTFGFSLSKRQGNHLRELIRRGKKVKLWARVDGDLFPGKLDVVTATIPGNAKATEEVFLIAHLCHPKQSANDNASGSGLLLEVARTIRRLVDSGKIGPPARTIRFLWVPETLGSVAFLQRHEELHSRMIAGIDLDMVGENQELCKSTLNLDRTPDSLPSYLNDHVYGLLEKVEKEFDAQSPYGSTSTFRFASQTYSGGSDHAEFNNSTVHVPCVMLLQWPDLYYHTSLDTIDKVSEDTLRRVGWVVTNAILTLADAGEEEALLFAGQTALRGMARLGEVEREAVEELLKKKQQENLGENSEALAMEILKTAAHHRNRVEHAMWREQQAVKSVGRLAQTEGSGELLEDYCRHVAEFGDRTLARLEALTRFVTNKLGLTAPTRPEKTQAEMEAEKLVPRRLFKGTLSLETFKKILGEKEFEWYRQVEEKDVAFMKKVAEIVNFADGRRNVCEIVKAVSAEYDRTETEHVLKFFRDLEKVKLAVFQ